MKLVSQEPWVWYHYIHKDKHYLEVCFQTGGGDYSEYFELSKDQTEQARMNPETIKELARHYAFTFDPEFKKQKISSQNFDLLMKESDHLA